MSSVNNEGVFGPLYRAIDAALAKRAGFHSFSTIMGDPGVKQQMHAVGTVPGTVSQYLSLVSRKKIRRLPRDAMDPSFLAKQDYHSKYFYSWNNPATRPGERSHAASLAEAARTQVPAATPAKKKAVKKAPNGHDTSRQTLAVDVNPTDQTMKVSLGNVEVCLRVTR